MYSNITGGKAMHIITIGMNKGGTGKTTITFNFVYKLSRMGKRVLLIDGDHSTNLTFTMQVIANTIYNEESILDIFTKKRKELFQQDLSMIYEINENISFIPGNPNLTEKYLKMNENVQKGKLMSRWIATNYEILNENFDYIIIDTHNDESLITQDFYVASDIIIAVANPAGNSVRAYFQLKNLIKNMEEEYYNTETGESLVEAKIYLLGNNVNHIGSTSRTFNEEIQHIDDLIGVIPKKELLDSSLNINEDIFTQYDKMSNAEKHRNQAFYDNINQAFEKIINLAEGA